MTPAQREHLCSLVNSTDSAMSVDREAIRAAIDEIDRLRALVEAWRPLIAGLATRNAFGLGLQHIKEARAALALEKGGA